MLIMTLKIAGFPPHNFNEQIAYTIKSQSGLVKTYIVKAAHTQLPILKIYTANEAPIISKENYIDASFTLTQGLEQNLLAEGQTEIRGRGSSTWLLMEKKPYRIKLDKKKSLLGMPESKTWVLLANHADKSLMRNELALSLSRSLGMAFTTRSRYVDVFLNNEFIGNYLLTESITEGKNKVDVEASADAVGIGGYLLEATGKVEEPAAFRTSKDINIDIKYPDYDIISPIQRAYIIDHYNKFEQALFSNEFEDTNSGYQKYLDIDSYIDSYLVNEVMGNPDFFWSTYMYKKQNDNKIYTGPIWDFDIAANNDTNVGNTVNALVYSFSFANTRSWFTRLMQSAIFRKRIKERWNLHKTKILELPKQTNDLVKKIKFSQEKNFSRWDILNTKVYREFNISGSFLGEVDYLREYLIKRINWLDLQFNSSNYN